MVLAQQRPDSVRQNVRGGSAEPEGVGFSWKPSAMRLGMDVSRLTLSLLDEDGRYYEINTDLQFGRYLLIADLGTGKQNRSYFKQLDYGVEGNYFRLGADVNLIPESKENNVLFVGLRYGFSTYTEKLVTSYTDPVFSTSSDPFPFEVNRSAAARWFEGVAGLKARVWEGLSMGYTLRYKLGVKARNTGSFTSYEIPGFGVVGDGNTFAFNYHVFYRIPFR